jgi:hypothetical protein
MADERDGRTQSAAQERIFMGDASAAAALAPPPVIHIIGVLTSTPSILMLAQECWRIEVIVGIDLVAGL